MKQNPLDKARQLISRRKFAQAARLLEKDILYNRQNSEYFYTLSLACLFHGDHEGAGSYLKRCLSIEPEHVDALLIDAALSLYRNDAKTAMQNYLAILEIEPKNKKAAYGLSLLRKRTKRDQHTFFEPAVIKKLYPDFSFKARLSWIIVPAVLLFIIAGVLIIKHTDFKLFLQSIPFVNKAEPERPRSNINQIVSSVTESRNEVQTNEDLSINTLRIYNLNEKEVVEAFSKAKQLFSRNMDNAAQRELNRIFYSHSSLEVKEKARHLMQFVKKQTFTTLHTTYKFEEITRQPYLYENCYIRWSGKVVNIEPGTENINFELLAGYQNETILEGVVDCKLPFAYVLEENSAYEIIGRVQVINQDIFILVTGIHPLL